MTIPPVSGHLGIDEIQQQRGSVYGKFELQAKCVGSIVKTLCNTAVLNGKPPEDEEIGAFAYIAIKLARYAVSPKHEDTLTDLMIYCKLIRQMETGKDCKIEDINT